MKNEDGGQEVIRYRGGSLTNSGRARGLCLLLLHSTLNGTECQRLMLTGWRKNVSIPRLWLGGAEQDTGRGSFTL